MRVALLALTLLSGCGEVASNEQHASNQQHPDQTPPAARLPARHVSPRQQKVIEAIQAHFGGREGDEDDSVRIGFADLNRDGSDEAFAFIEGAQVCGSGGCNLYVLSRVGRRYRFVAKTTVTSLPVRLLSSSSFGWRDISVHVEGGGSKPHDAVLRFNGGKYPGNPSMEPAAPRHVRERTILSAESEAIRLYE